jgi:hypothetical protein
MEEMYLADFLANDGAAKENESVELPNSTNNILPVQPSISANELELQRLQNLDHSRNFFLSKENTLKAAVTKFLKSIV